MVGKDVKVITLPPDQIAILKQNLAPVGTAAIEAQDKAGARAFLAAYTAWCRTARLVGSGWCGRCSCAWRWQRWSA